MQDAEQVLDMMGGPAGNIVQESLAFDHLDTIMSGRYGLIPGTLSVAATQEAIADAIKVFKPHYTTEAVTDTYHAPIYQFVQDLTNNRTPMSTYCDWAMSIDQLRALYPNRQAKVTRTRDGWIVNGVHETGNKSLVEAPWVIYTEDALTVMEIIRRNWGPSNIDIAKELMQRGISWRMMYITSKQPAIERPLRQSISVLPVTMTLNGSEPNVRYNVYERLRRQFLLQPRAKVVLQYGGILWRTGIDVIDIDQVLAAGPSHDLRHAFTIRLPDGTWAVGDGLGEEEIELVLGMYHTYNRKYATRFNIASSNY